MINNDDIMERACRNSLNPPHLLYHYTNADGLKGIIETGIFHATHFLFLNDPSEISYSLDLINDVLIGVIKNEKNRQVKDTIKDLINKNYIQNIHYQGFLYDVFIASFSENGDQLSQWRGYADNGMGYSIGIDPYKIQQIKFGIKYTMNLNINRPINLVKVEYDKEQQRNIIKKSFISLLSKINRCIAVNNEKQTCPIFSNLPSILSNLISRLALLFKNQSFNEEKEWRLLLFDRYLENNNCNNTISSNINIRNKKGLLLPYVEFDLKESDNKHRIPLKKIIIGPRQNLKQARRALDLLLFKKGYNEDVYPEILNSTIPYS